MISVKNRSKHDLQGNLRGFVLNIFKLFPKIPKKTKKGQKFQSRDESLKEIVHVTG